MTVRNVDSRWSVGGEVLLWHKPLYFVCLLPTCSRQAVDTCSATPLFLWIQMELTLDYCDKQDNNVLVDQIKKKTLKKKLRRIIVKCVSRECLHDVPGAIDLLLLVNHGQSGGRVAIFVVA